MAFGRFSRMNRESGSKIDQAGSAEKPLIQVIDDDLRIRQGLKLYLQKAYRIRLCPTGEEGINTVDANVSVVILDIKMPGKNGLQVYDAIKAKFPDLPIIFYSAYQSVLEGAELSRKYRPFNYIDKSANVQELIDTVERAVNYAQTLRTLVNTERRLQEVRKKI